MAQNTLDSVQIKELFKQSIGELIQERRDLFYNLFAEAMEDAALAKAIKEGESSDAVTRDDVFKLLETGV